MVDTKELCKRVRQYALEHYNEDGWDFVVECWDDADIIKESVLLGNIDHAFNVAINRIHEIVKIQNERRMDVESEIF